MEVVNTVSSFGIRQLTGRSPKELTLVGRGLPYRPLTLKTEQRLELTWYPGNPEATATVLGAKEAPTIINGAWKDKFIRTDIPQDQVVGAIGLQPNQISPILLDGTAAEDVAAAADYVDEIVRSGQLVEVTWDRVTRHGFLRTFDKSWLNTHDLEWSMAFEWISRGEQTFPAVIVAEQSIGDAANEMAQLAGDLEDAATDPPFAVVGEFYADLTEVLGTIQSRVGEVQSAVANQVDLALAPLDAVRRVVALSTAMIDDTQNLLDLMVSEVDGAFNTETLFPQLSFQQRLVTATYNRGVRRAARALQIVAIQRRDRLARTLEGHLLGTHTARSGQDLRDVSQLFYNTPFEWRRLLTFNQLTTPALVAGQLILVPQLTSDRC